MKGDEEKLLTWPPIHDVRQKAVARTKSKIVMFQNSKKKFVGGRFRTHIQHFSWKNVDKFSELCKVPVMSLKQFS